MKTRRAAFACLAAVLLTLTAGCSGSAGNTASTTTSVAPVAAPTPRSSPAPTKRPPSHAEVKAAVTKRIARIIHSQPKGSVSIAALNTRTGQHFAAGATSGMWTASAYKLFVLSTLLLGRSASSLSSGEVADAQRAIENSDNVAGYSLFLDAGGRGALSSGADQLGMKHTVPGESDPTFTTTSGPDLVRLMQVLVNYGPGKGTLSASAREFILNLMRQVEPDQRWGVGAIADKGTDFANKNGWLSIDDSNGPGETDDGLWAVTSTGVVTVDHQQVLMAVCTRHQQSYGSGVKLVERLARTMTPAVSG